MISFSDRFPGAAAVYDSTPTSIASPTGWMLNLLLGVVRPQFASNASKSTHIITNKCRLLSYSHPRRESEYIKIRFTNPAKPSTTTSNAQSSKGYQPKNQNTNTKYGSKPSQYFKMGKKKSSTPGEENLLLPAPPSTLPIVDTHTHVASTYEFYRIRYKEAKHDTVYSFLKGMFQDRSVEAVVDVWCEAPVRPQWKEFADAAVDLEKWGGTQYWFAIGMSF